MIIVPRDTAPVEGSRSEPVQWNALRDAARRWYHPLSQPDAWQALAYLALGTVTTSAWFMLVGTVAAVLAVAVWTVVGVLLVIPAFGIVAWCSTLERERARIVGARIDARPLADAVGLWARLRTRCTDPNRWRQVAYQLSAVFVAWTLAGVAFGAWAVVVYLVSLPLWGWAVGLSVPATFALAVFGVALAGLAPRVVDGHHAPRLAVARRAGPAGRLQDAIHVGRVHRRGREAPGGAQGRDRAEQVVVHGPSLA